MENILQYADNTFFIYIYITYIYIYCCSECITQFSQKAKLKSSYKVSD